MANVTTFATLKSELLAALGRAPADPVYQVVTKEINRDLRVRAMQNTMSVTEAASVSFSATITGATQANPCVITATGHGYETDAVVEITGVSGMTELNGNTYTITKVDADSFSLNSTDSSAFTAYTSGGSAELAIRGIVSVYRDTDPRTVLQPSTPQQIQRVYETSGNPTLFAFVDGKLLLDKPGASKTLEIRYWGDFAPFSADEDTNTILKRYPDIYWYGSLFHHARLVGDPRVDMWERDYRAAMAHAAAKDRRDAHRPGPVVPRVRHLTP